MKTPTFLRAHWLALLMIVGLPMACDDGTNPLDQGPVDDLVALQSPGRSPVKDPVTVLNRNIFHGGDIGPVLDAGFSDPFALMAAANQVWDQILNNNFAERAVALVDEIENTMPDFVGLQEVVRFEYVDGVTPAAFNIDLREILQAEIDSRGLPYSFGPLQVNTIVTVPLTGFVSFPGGSPVFTPTSAVTLIERDAVLVHDDLDVTATYQGAFADEPDLGPLISMRRGWIRVDADIDGVPHHFVNVHMEISSFPATQEAQTQELLNDVVAGLDGVTLMMGDFNSNADLAPGEGDYTSTYGDVLAAGFTDLWTMDNPGKNDPGYTCCHDHDLRDPDNGMEKRIDFIFMKTADPSAFNGYFTGTVDVDVVGDEVWEMTPISGMWPSDHAGVWASLWWAPGQMKKIH